MNCLVQLFIVCCLLTCSTVSAIGEDVSDTPVMSKSFGYAASNGNAWKKIDRQSKITYLLGIENGFYLFCLQLDDDSLFQTTDTKRMIRRTIDTLTISGFKFGDLVEQVDMIYSDSANIRIPVIESYRHVLKKLRGSEQEALAKDISMLRKKYNK